MSERQRFQGKCLQNDEGWKHMSNFDRLPWEVRNELRNSAFNLCPSCVHDIACGMGGGGWGDGTFYFIKAIREMEHQIRCEEAPQAQ